MLDDSQGMRRKFMLPKHYVVGGVVILLLFIIRISWEDVLSPVLPWATDSYRFVSVKESPQQERFPVDWSEEVSNLSIQLAHCEWKLFLDNLDTRKDGLQILTPWLAPIVWDGTYNLGTLNQQYKNTRIGLFVFAVKKYIQFLGPFLASAERYFMVGHKVTYYVFTDRVSDVIKPKLHYGRTLQLHEASADKRWQDVSMRRMQTLTTWTKNRMLKEIDYLICADVDMVFNDHVGVEILGDLVATLHPGFFLAQPESFPYERDPISKAFIPFGQGDFYYMAALYGGRVKEVYKLSMACHKGIMLDKRNYVEAVWQEESHLNRYLLYNKPTKVLSPEYLWDTSLPNGKFIRRQRFLAVHKNHTELRD
ncbi:histo-blood group ABO system transferase 2-like [Hyperolius riggenbachi]|uniref:histo-blood group ABO system transferase 2-like n=1 Tax=Hyperolius riggenbachi TaxID=752182 RepID=UPI0035A2885F